MAIERIHCNSAREFVDLLRLSNPKWLGKTDWESPWIFRGERNEDWRLVPSAWRDSAKSHILYQTISRWNHKTKLAELLADSELAAFRLKENPDRALQLLIQSRFEFLAARAFADFVDQLGLPIPGGTFPDHKSFEPLTWFNRSIHFHPTVALAQHHGMPTRLLDWTFNPLKAAFFATDEVSPEEAGNVLVWAANRMTLNDLDYNILTVPRSFVGFLHAQEGLFTYPDLTMAENYFIGMGAWPTLDESINDGLCRVTLPKSEAPEVTRLLWAERINKAHLMPALDNIPTSLKVAWSSWLKNLSAEASTESA